MDTLNRLADDHIQAVDQTIDDLKIGKIGVNEASRRLKNLDYTHEEAWEMVHEHTAKPKIIKIT